MQTEAKESHSNSLDRGESVQQLIIDALHAVADELSSLEMLPERRYDTSVFPTIGQYDWALGQVLYALVRYLRPRRIIEFSTSSGYSTTFTALALAKNGSGIVESVDIDRRAQTSAGGWLQQLGVAGHVRLHEGDCRNAVPPLLAPDVDILFIDTLHSFDIAEWYLLELIPKLNPTTFVHIHDVMPPDARVRVHGGPPYAAEPPLPRPSATYLVKRAIWLLLHGKVPNPFPARAPRETVPLDRLETFPGRDGQLATIDGNYFEEATLVRELLRDVDHAEAVYVHRLASSLPVVDAQRYAEGDRIQRTNADGTPLEWNDALWCRAGTLQRNAPSIRVRALISQLRARYYGA